jgi:hypothetical protein
MPLAETAPRRLAAAETVIADDYPNEPLGPGGSERAEEAVLA